MGFRASGFGFRNNVGFERFGVWGFALVGIGFGCFPQNPEP